MYHKITNQAVMTVFRPQPTESAKEIYGFELLSSTGWKAPQQDPFLPTHFVDIQNYLKKKLKALKAYQEEMRPSPHSRSLKHVEHLAGHRGHSVGLKAAEAFVVYRKLR
jgi:LmbE family N-acetylglucosaminyl deacetylase